jgi:pSer/pThr/pTyr-binding forkhead associated (FHA) protein
VSYLHCPECGFQNPEASNFCEKCGALLIGEEGTTESTLTLHPDQLEDSSARAATGTAIIVRSGGGRAGEAYVVERDRLSIGRSPDSDIFLDDVTVSRRHADLVRKDSGFLIEDLGSLNGTFVNRKRVESHRLEDGDEVQIGKYKLTFLER